MREEANCKQDIVQLKIVQGQLCVLLQLIKLSVPTVVCYRLCVSR